LRQAALTGTGLAGCALCEPAAAALLRAGAAPAAGARLPSGIASPAGDRLRILTTDASVQWHLANPLGIRADEGEDAWHAGHVNDVLAFADGAGLLVGADTGGVWLITPADQAIPLSDSWDVPDVTCLAQGPDGPRHVYAGCWDGDRGVGALYETNAASGVPLLDWRPVPLPGAAGGVFRIAVLTGARLLVLACSGGVFWSSIPRPGGAYLWKAARRLPGGTYSGLAVGPGGTVAVAAWGSVPDLEQCGIFSGGWSGGELVMRRSFLQGACAADMYRTSLAACPSQPNVMYAVSARAGFDSWIYAVLKSTDGGRTFNRLANRATRDDRGQSAPLESIDPDLAGGQGSYNQCIAVSPNDPNLVVIGWRNGPWISTDGGLSWEFRQNSADSPHLHSDLHALTFDPSDPSGKRFYIGSDGGVAMTADLAQSFESHYNRGLTNLQFLGPSGLREWWGMFNASYQVPGLVAGGLQDNGGVYCRLEPELTPWRVAEGGDGGSALFIRTGQLLYNDAGGEATQYANWNGSGLDPQGIIPVRGARPLPDGLHEPVIELVNSPEYRNAAGQWMFAVGAIRAQEIYGLFADGNGSDLHWEYLVTVPTETSEGIGALGSGNGRLIYVGTGTGRIFGVSTPDLAQEMTVAPRSDGTGRIPRIVVQSNALAFALFNRGGDGYVMRQSGLRWEALDGGLPNSTFYAMDTDWSILPKPLFVVTDDQVYVSRDDGDTWQGASQGLPRRVHGSDLRFVSAPDGTKSLYLSTFGRSLWRARLG
jgi:hypothetical protein